MASDHHQHGINQRCPLCELEEIGKSFYGWVQENSDCITSAKFIQYRFPRSKKRRIRKKWAKNPDNWVTLIGVKRPQDVSEEALRVIQRQDETFVRLAAEETFERIAADEATSAEDVTSAQPDNEDTE